VNTNITRAPAELVQRFAKIPSSNISDCMNRLYSMKGSLRPYNSIPLAGTAFTVRVPANDNAFIHYALDLVKPGDILVVDAGGEVGAALMGEIMFTYAQQRGITGIIVDGAIRDVDCLQTLPLAVYAKGVTPRGPYKTGPGEINQPVSCGGQVVFPGDILIGDADGVIVIPQDDAPHLVDLAEAKLQDEERRLARYRLGELDAEKHFKEYHDLLVKLGAKL